MRYYFTLFILLFFINFCISQNISIGSCSEYDSAKVILMHQPSDELFYGVIHPDAALFEDYFSSYLAKEEHKAYQELLKSKNIKVLTVREILLDKTIDVNGKIIEGEELEKLQTFAKKYIKLNTDNINSYEKNEQIKYLNNILNKMHPYDLVNIILLQPIITLKKTDINTFYTADYNVNPVMNLYFLRDQLITTKKGNIIGKLNSNQRAVEADIIEFCLNKIGAKPLYRINGEKAFLEGGDFLTFGDYAFIGCGLRTTQEAINQLLSLDLFGAKKLIVVKDTWHNQAQMHLDTYFNIIDKNLVALSQKRFNANENDSLYLKADIYEKVGDSYVKTDNDLNFVKYLTKTLNVEIISISDEDQLNYGVNFLTIAPREIIAVKGLSDLFKLSMSKHNVKVNWIDFSNLKLGYGAAHCTTQVLQRKH